MILLILSSIEETISQLFPKLQTFLLVVSLPAHQFCNIKVSVNMTMNRMKDLNSTMIIFFQETKYKIYYQHFSSRLNWIKTEQVIPIFCFKNQLFSIKTSQQTSFWADEVECLRYQVCFTNYFDNKHQNDHEHEDIPLHDSNRQARRRGTDAMGYPFSRYLLQGSIVDF